MLHAVQNHKTRLHRRYLGERDGDELRVHEEDEITSTVLGPMAFLAPSAAHQFWREVLASVGKANFLPSDVPDGVILELWKRRPASDDSGTIEPDAIVSMTWPNQPVYTLLIELKWRARLSGDDQLSRQWLHYLNEEERKTALHLFIAPEISVGASAYEEGIWRDQMVLLPWQTIRSTLGVLANERTPLGRWAQLADVFLERLNIRRFDGFRRLFSEPAPDIPETIPTPIFWMTKPFWVEIGRIPTLPFSDSSIFFYNR